MIHFCLYLEIFGLVLRCIPQHGHHSPSQFTNISQTLHLFWPLAYRNPLKLPFVLYLWQTPLQTNKQYLILSSFYFTKNYMFFGIIKFNHWFFSNLIFCSTNICLLFTVLGLCRNSLPQQGQYLPSHTKYTSHEAHLFWPLAYRSVCEIQLGLWWWQIPLQGINDDLLFFNSRLIFFSVLFVSRFWS